jgi:hypothetical protein
MTMHTYAIFAGFGLMAAGIAHLLKPDLLRPGIWAKSYATEHNSASQFLTLRLASRCCFWRFRVPDGSCAYPVEPSSCQFAFLDCFCSCMPLSDA